MNSESVIENVKHTDFKFGGGFVIDGKDIYIKEIIYNNPATIVFWSDGTKTVSKCCEGDDYNHETGLSICVLKKIIGGKKVKILMDDWLPYKYINESYLNTTHPTTHITIKDVRSANK